MICRKYDNDQLQSVSFVHAMTRSLTAAKLEKKILRNILRIFAWALCCNKIKTLYDLLGLFVDIFGNPKNWNAQKNIERLLSLECSVNSESLSSLIDTKKIFKKAKKKDEDLKVVGKYLCSYTAINHQSLLM